MSSPFRTARDHGYCSWLQSLISVDDVAGDIVCEILLVTAMLNGLKLKITNSTGQSLAW